MDGPRVAISYDSPGSIEGEAVQLPSPNTGKLATYIIRGASLLEVNFFKEPYRSWFVGQQVIQDGGVYMFTPVDPLFALLPILERGRRKSVDSQGLFCNLLDLLEGENCHALKCVVENLGNQIQCICDLKQVGDDAYVRLNDNKVIAWLKLKARAVLHHMKSTGTFSMVEMDSESQMGYVVGFLSEYLPPDWARILGQHLGVDVQKGASTLAQRNTTQASPMKKRQKVSMEMNATPEAGGKSQIAKQLAKSAVGTKKITSFFSKPKK